VQGLYLWFWFGGLLVGDPSFRNVSFWHHFGYINEN